MRGSTARKILLGTIGGMALLMILAGVGREALPMVLVFLTVAGLLYLQHRIRDVPRREAYRDSAKALGLRPDPALITELEALPHPLLHRIAETRDLDNVLSGTWGAREFATFDYRYTAGSDGQGQPNVAANTCALTSVPRSWADLVVEPERLQTTFAERLALRDIELESETFNRAFEVRSTDPRFASAFLDARMMAWLLQEAPAGFGVEIVGSRLLVFVPQLRPWELGSLLVAVEAFLRQVPAVIASLYPGLSPQAGTGE